MAYGESDGRVSTDIVQTTEWRVRGAIMSERSSIFARSDCEKGITFEVSILDAIELQLKKGIPRKFPSPRGSRTPGGDNHVSRRLS